MKKRQKEISKEEEFQRVIFEMYYEKVYKTAYFIVKDSHLAQDITQDTFIKAFDKIGSLKDKSKIGGWLGTIATRMSLDYLRKIKRRNDSNFDDVYINERTTSSIPAVGVEQEVEMKLLQETIRKNLSKLEPPEYREVVLLKYMYELSDQEIADVIGISLSATKSRLHRAKLKLKSIFSKQGLKKGGAKHERKE